jgi:hypothetical protein
VFVGEAVRVVTVAQVSPVAAGDIVTGDKESTLNGILSANGVNDDPD